MTSLLGGQAVPAIENFDSDTAVSPQRQKLDPTVVAAVVVSPTPRIKPLVEQLLVGPAPLAVVAASVLVVVLPAPLAVAEPTLLAVVAASLSLSAETNSWLGTVAL